MNEKEALLLIEEMISSTKQELKDNGFYYYFWGWLVFTAAVSNAVILHYSLLEMHSLPWIVLMPLGGLVTFIMGKVERNKKVRAKTYVSESMQAMVIAFSVSLFIVCFAMPAGNQWKAFYPTIMILYAIWLFVSGKLLKFKPLIWGGILNWILALIGFILASTMIHLMLIAGGVLGGFIIPGYLLKSKAQKGV